MHTIKEFPLFSLMRKNRLISNNQYLLVERIKHTNDRHVTSLLVQVASPCYVASVYTHIRTSVSHVWIYKNAAFKNVCFIVRFFKQVWREVKGPQIFSYLKTYAAFSNAHLSRVWNGESCLGPVFRPLKDSDQHSFRYSYVISVFRHFLHKITN